MRTRAVEGFQSRFGRPPALLVRAPGRVNLLGEHTDYNEGYVLPAAIDRAVWLAIAPLDEPLVRLTALDLNAEATFRLDAIPPRQGDWADYARGVAWALQERGLPTAGLVAAFTSDVPIGAGLSSSAAVEVAFACAWQALAGFDLPRRQLALLCQHAENAYVGVRCGIMDQMASVCGQAGHALLLDCRSLEVTPVPLPADVALLVVDSGVRRSLAASEYNRRRAECEEAVRLLAQHLPGIRALRDVSLADFERYQHVLPDVLRRRVRHVVNANARVLEAVEALRESDLARFGAAMRHGHESLRDDYEVSAPELDLLVETAWEAPGCYGARLTGAGFGGCILALAESAAVEELSDRLRQAYQARFDRQPVFYLCHAADGAGVCR